MTSSLRSSQRRLDCGNPVCGFARFRLILPSTNSWWPPRRRVSISQGNSGCFLTILRKKSILRLHNKLFFAKGCDFVAIDIAFLTAICLFEDTSRRKKIGRDSSQIKKILINKSSQFSFQFIVLDQRTFFSITQSLFSRIYLTRSWMSPFFPEFFLLFTSYWFFCPKPSLISFLSWLIFFYDEWWENRIKDTHSACKAETEILIHIKVWLRPKWWNMFDTLFQRVV